MNKKGFTLIELLMVIVLIGILALILSPNIISIVNKNNQKSCESFKNNIISATKMYVAENKYDLGFSCPSGGNVKTISKDTLITSGYLNEDIDISADNKYFKYNDKKSTKIEIIVTYDCDNKIFSYEANFNCDNE